MNLKWDQLQGWFNIRLSNTSFKWERGWLWWSQEDGSTQWWLIGCRSTSAVRCIKIRMIIRFRVSPWGPIYYPLTQLGFNYLLQCWYFTFTHGSDSYIKPYVGHYLQRCATGNPTSTSYFISHPSLPQPIQYFPPNLALCLYCQSQLIAPSSKPEIYPHLVFISPYLSYDLSSLYLYHYLYFSSCLIKPFISYIS